jgi:hypothetical protein
VSLVPDLRNRRQWSAAFPDCSKSLSVNLGALWAAEPVWTLRRSYNFLTAAGLLITIP